VSEDDPPARWRGAWTNARSHALAAVTGAWLYAQFDRLMDLLAKLTSM
jgi:hypothetical protein